MGIKRYIATQDSSITDAFKENLLTRATSSNMGASDSLEVFSLYGQSTTTSLEKSRILVQFPIDTIISDRDTGNIPGVGSVNFFVKLSNAPHPNSLPRNFTLSAQAVSRSWTEGIGLDMEDYLDVGAVNWASASVNTPWNTPGGDYHASPTYTQYFDNGYEDLQLNITSLVEEWIAGTKGNNGIGIMLDSTQETGSTSFYTKKFFARGSQFFYKRPWIEAQFDSSKKDDRRSFYLSSSLAPAEDNLNTIFLYNRFRGKLVNIPAVGTGSIFVSLYSGSTVPLGNPLTLHKDLTVVTGGFVSTGIYSASLAINTSFDYVFDVWHNNAGIQFTTGSKITIVDPVDESDPSIPNYVLNITNLKSSYSTLEKARLNLFVRNKDWQPTIYTVATNTAEGVSVEDAYFSIFRVTDNYNVISYGTGSQNHTRLSLDRNGNYFDLHMNLLEPGYTYGIKFLFKNSLDYFEQKEVFKFRVD